MGSLVPRLTLFPTYSGGPRVQASQGTLTANSSFRLPQTEFTPAYGVNLPAGSTEVDNNYFLRATANQTLERVPVSQARDYTQTLAFNPTAASGISTGNPLSVSDAPTIPNRYEAFIRALEVSDVRMDDLLAQPSFRLSQIGPGYRVTTDGAGGIDRITADPSLQAAMGRVGKSDPSYLLPNTADITQRAVLRSANAVPSVADPSLKPGMRPVGQDAGVNANLANNLFQLSRPELQGAGLFPNAGLQAKNPLDALGRNPVLEKLLQLQPQNPGLAVSGLDSQMDVTAARQLAASQAKLDVSLSPSFQDNLAALQKANIEQGKLYQQTGGAQLFARQMDGMIPWAPSLPQPTRTAGEMGLIGQGLSEAFKDAMGGMSDAVSKRGSDGYLSFGASSGGTTSGGEGAFGGATNPFAGQGESDPRRRRRSLSYQA